MKRRRKKLNKYRKRFLAVRVIFLLFPALLLLGGGTAVAKYYSLQRQKGVAVASNFYFESDHLDTVNYVDHALNFADFPVYMASGKWSGTGKGEARVSFSIRNYENKLLYNKGLDIVYNLYVKMEAADDTAITYKLSYEDKTVDIKTITEASCVFENIVLKGADEKSNTYSNEFEIVITPNGVMEQPRSIYVWAVPQSPSYIKKENYTLGAAISVTKSQQAFMLSGGFEIAPRLSGENTVFDEQDKAVINGQSGLVYNITTIGEYKGENQVPLELSWNAKYLEIDHFNKLYEKYQKNLSVNGDIRTLKAWIDIYSSEKIVFYRTEDFDLTDSSMDSNAEFCGLVTVKEAEEKIE